MDVDALGHESFHFLKWSASSFIFLSSTVILLSLFLARMWSMYHCVPTIVCTLKNATVCSVRPCSTCLAPYPRKWIISCPGSSQGGLCEPLFWQTFISPNFLPLLPLSILPSHTSTPWASRLIYLLDSWHGLSLRTFKLNQGLSHGHWFSSFIFLPIRNILESH